MTKENVKRDNLAQLAARREELRRRPRLTFLFAELTDSCNLRCLHCGSSCAPANKRFLNEDALIKTLTELAEDYDPSRVMICLTGGEPLLHPQFFRIVREIRRLGFPWGMTTNGTLIDEATALRLKESEIGSITLSLDGLEQTHDWLRGCRGCFRKTLRAVENLHEASIPVQITSVIHKKNFSELEPLFQLVSELQVSSWRVVNIEPIGRAQENRSLLLDYREVLQLLDFIREKRFCPDVSMDVRYGCSHYLSFEYEHEVRDNYFLCGAGILVGSILCNGDICSCLDIARRADLVQGNIERDRFSDVWEKRFAVFRTDRSGQSPRCRSCKERAFCAGDSTHTWDFDRNEPLFCILRKDDLYGELT